MIVMTRRCGSRLTLWREGRQRWAKNFAAEASAATVFVASGESLVDSISVAGLAGSLNAPVLLTRGGALHNGVADFIEDEGATQVYVLGGIAAISDAVMTAIESLDNKPNVERIQGPDRYATAAAIAGKISSAQSWCYTPGVDVPPASAVLINGATDALPFGVAVSTMAYALKVPVLMTAADELPESTADYIREKKIDHVQIIGGTDVVSSAVADALTTAGVDTVQRTDGSSAAEVSVKLAQLANSGCGGLSVPVSTNRVVLVRGNPDGVAAAPTLASTLHRNHLVTPLIVGDARPDVVRDYLEATPKTVGGAKLHLGIVAVGGTAAVSASVMDAATAASSSSGALSLQIGAGDDPATTTTLEGDNNDDKVTNADDPVRPSAAGDTTSSFALYFSDNVTIGDPTSSTAAEVAANAALVGMLQDIIEVNGVPADVDAAVTGVSAGACANDVVYVTLGQTLKDGDTISVATSGHMLGTGGDQRTIATASTTVQAAPADTTGPSVSIVAIAGARTGTTPAVASNQFDVRIEDLGGLTTKTLTASDFAYTPGRGSTNTRTSTLTIDSSSAVITAASPSHTTTVTLPNALVAGDTLTLKAGRVKDASGNSNRPGSGTAIAAQASPSIGSVSMSNLSHSVQNVWTLPATAADATTASDPSGAVGANAVTITAKATGDAAGAAGNAWSILFDTASTYMASKPLDIDVSVDTKRQRVTVRFVNGAATVHDLVAALRANSDFDSRFGVAIPCSGTTMAPLAISNANRDVPAVTDGVGRTQFAIEVNFNAYIDEYTGTALLDAVLAQTVQRNKVADSAALLDLAGFITAGATAAADTPANPPVPVKNVRFEFEVSSSTVLPQAGDRVVTAAGHTGASAIAGPPAYAAIDPVTPVALGFAADAGAAPLTASDLVDEDKNGASNRPIAISSSVKARN